MNQLLIEMYCLKRLELNDNISKPTPPFCQGDYESPSYNCLKNSCPFLAHATCENTLCYINEKSEVEYGITYGGEMCPTSALDDEGIEAMSIEQWKRISSEVISNAYDQYMSELSEKS
jgi:hypothetical protein